MQQATLAPRYKAAALSRLIAGKYAFLIDRAVAVDEEGAAALLDSAVIQEAVAVEMNSALSTYRRRAS
jgi:hypothetical protein